MKMISSKTVNRNRAKDINESKTFENIYLYSFDLYSKIKLKQEKIQANSIEN